jgi:glutathione peroxidase
MFSKVEVNGEGACELYKFLTQGQPQVDGVPDISWNFTKFLIDRTGAVVRRFEPKVTPEEIAQVLPEYL